MNKRQIQEIVESELNEILSDEEVVLAFTLSTYAQALWRVKNAEWFLKNKKLSEKDQDLYKSRVSKGKSTMKEMADKIRKNNFSKKAIKDAIKRVWQEWGKPGK